MEGYACDYGSFIPMASGRSAFENTSRHNYGASTTNCFFSGRELTVVKFESGGQMSQTTVPDTLVYYCSSRGVVNIFGVLPHTSFAIGDAIARQPHMKFVNAQHEGGAGNMALGY